MKSMSGFGRAQSALPDGTQISITVRGVNHRFLDLSLKMRDDLGALEAPLRKLVSSAVARGHVDLSVRVSKPAGGAVSIDGATAGRYAQEWRRLAEVNALPGRAVGARPALAAGRRPRRRGRGGRIARGRDPRRDPRRARRFRRVSPPRGRGDGGRPSA